MEIDAAEPLATALAPVCALNPLNVPLTISANAAITINENNQQNKKNNFLPVLPMLSSTILPID